MIENRVDIPLILFAKAPIAGQVKTRLTSDCSDEQAAEIAKILLEETLRKARLHWPGKVYLSTWNFNQNPFIVSMLKKFDVELLLQVAGNLGAKMHSTFEQIGYPAAIMGCDAPLVSSETFKLAYTTLKEGKNVIGPSEDGGYYLIGASEPIPVVFDGIRWGADSVLTQTLALAEENDVEFSKLPESYDIDYWQDVEKASILIPALHKYLVSL